MLFLAFGGQDNKYITIKKKIYFAVKNKPVHCRDLRIPICGAVHICDARDNSDVLQKHDLSNLRLIAYELPKQNYMTENSFTFS